MGKPKLALLFMSGLSGTPDVMAQLLQALGRIVGDTIVVGQTTAGAHFTEAGAATRGVAGMFWFGDDIDVAISFAEGISTDPEGAAKRAAEALPAATKHRSQQLLVFANGLNTDGNLLATAVRKNTPAAWRVIGGMAGDDWRFVDSHVFARGRLLKDAVVLARLDQQTPPAIACRHGFSIIPAASELHVTELNDKGIVKLNRRPAREVYSEELKRLGFWDGSSDIVPTMAKYPLALRTPFGEKLIIRAPLGLGDKDEIWVNAGVTKNDVLHIVTTDVKAVLSSTHELCAKTAKEASTARLVFDCGGRRALMTSEYEKLVEAFRGGTSTPMLGATTYGEIMINAGSVHHFHNYTGVIAAF